MNFSNSTSSAFTKWLGILGISLAAAGSYAAENSAPAGNERCVQIKDIRRTEVVDDQNILFHLRNHKIYNNHLPHRCSGLTQSKTFSYKTSQSELCNVDIITVLLTAGGGYTPGASCGLGLFEPVDPKAIEAKAAQAKTADSHSSDAKKTEKD